MFKFRRKSLGPLIYFSFILNPKCGIILQFVYFLAAKITGMNQNKAPSFVCFYLNIYDRKCLLYNTYCAEPISLLCSNVMNIYETIDRRSKVK